MDHQNCTPWKDYQRTAGRQHHTVTTPAALHQEIAIPFVGHGEREIDSKFLAANFGAVIDHSINPAVRR
jgi:hypothetical protein